MPGEWNSEPHLIIEFMSLRAATAEKRFNFRNQIFADRTTEKTGSKLFFNAARKAIAASWRAALKKCAVNGA